MSAPVASTEPLEITQGRTVKWTRAARDYPPDDGWQLSYSIVYGTTTLPLVWGTHVTQSGDGFAITLPATLITGLTAGVDARLNGVVTLAGEVFDVYDGALRVKVVGELSHARKTLSAIESTLAGNATMAESEMELSGGGVNQRMSMCSKDELIRWHRHYKALVADEDAKERRAAGLSTGRVIRNRYTTPS